MEWHLLENIPFAVDEKDFLAHMRVKADSGRQASCRKVLVAAQAQARPRAVYVPARIEALDETGMTVAGRRFTSSLFAPRLQSGEEIYFFLATCGVEIAAWSGSFRDDLLKSYWADCLAELALRAARAALEEALRPFIADEYVAAMDPGSLAEWPISEQQPLFALMGGAAHACGVSLNEQCMMQPQKSVSGFYFSSSEEYYNCALCPRLRCSQRRVAFAG